MELKKQINTILTKQLSREDFIKHIAIGAVAMVGGGALVRMGLSGSVSGRTSQQIGYGDSAYGGINQGGKPARRAA